ncbi:MAG: ABC transporter permease [Ruminococcus sp.]|nr:ABC transporter permease [Ruminococcus sp.]
MLFKLSLNNIRKSLRDYAIYFFTLVIGVSVFYVFNAIGGQAAMMRVNDSQYNIVYLLKVAISGTSVFVAGVLGLLIVYASRFLMKRRNKEFALYMTLGMSKGKISAILLIETLIIGIGSLFIGLLAGIGLSQLMSALVANLFEADMTAYKFTVSGEAIIKTIIYFAVMYLVVMIFNSFVVTKMKLIDLMQSGKRSEQIKLKNPWFCVIVFLLAAAALGYAYYQVGWNSKMIERNQMILYVALGCISTVLIFWSVSGMLLRVLMSMKRSYYRGLNAFTFRQISSTVNTMVLSMSVICLMLFLTICALTSAFTVRNAMNSNIKNLCPADFEYYTSLVPDEPTEYNSFTEMCEKNGYDLSEDFDKCVDVMVYTDNDLTFEKFFGDTLKKVQADFPFMQSDITETIMTVSDYNAVMDLYGKDKLTLGENEFIMLCNYKPMVNFRNEVLGTNNEITVFGRTLKSKYDECTDGAVDLSADRTNMGIIIVPDDVKDDSSIGAEYFIGNYRSDDKEAAEKIVLEKIDQVDRDTAGMRNADFFVKTSKIEICTAMIGLGAILTFLGLYIGLVFLIASGVILALKVLSESTDSIGRYEMLRKIGAEENEISRSLFRQTGIFFILPLLLGILHSVFGIKFAVYFMESFGIEKIFESTVITSAILLFIYGGYFLVTYFSSRSIIRDKR